MNDEVVWSKATDGLRSLVPNVEAVPSPQDLDSMTLRERLCIKPSTYGWYPEGTSSLQYFHEKAGPVQDLLLPRHIDSEVVLALCHSTRNLAQTLPYVHIGIARQTRDATLQTDSFLAHYNGIACLACILIVNCGGIPGRTYSGSEHVASAMKTAEAYEKRLKEGMNSLSDTVLVEFVIPVLD